MGLFQKGVPRGCFIGEFPSPRIFFKPIGFMPIGFEPLGFEPLGFMPLGFMPLGDHGRNLLGAQPWGFLCPGDF